MGAQLTALTISSCQSSQSYPALKPTLAPPHNPYRILRLPPIRATSSIISPRLALSLSHVSTFQLFHIPAWKPLAPQRDGDIRLREKSQRIPSVSSSSGNFTSSNSHSALVDKQEAVFSQLNVTLQWNASVMFQAVQQYRGGRG